MKHGKRPTVAQRNYIRDILKISYPMDWLVVKDNPSEMVIVHKFSDKIKVWRKVKCLDW